MSAQLVATLTLGHSTDIVCPVTGRSGTGYYSFIPSTSSDQQFLTLNVKHYGEHEPLPMKTCSFVHGQMKEGSLGAFADVEVLDDQPMKICESIGDAVITVSGKVHKKYHKNIGDCFVIRVPGEERQWFFAVSLAHFAPHIEQAISISDTVKVSGTFSAILHRSDALGAVVELCPRSLSFPERNLKFFPNSSSNSKLSSTVDIKDPNAYGETLQDLMMGRFPYEIPSQEETAKPEPAWITDMIKREADDD